MSVNAHLNLSRLLDVLQSANSQIFNTAVQGQNKKTMDLYIKELNNIKT